MDKIRINDGFVSFDRNYLSPREVQFLVLHGGGDLGILDFRETPSGRAYIDHYIGPDNDAGVQLQDALEKAILGGGFTVRDHEHGRPLLRRKEG
ncbi:hypothetical protein A2363_00510 [Candidatus Gottesmanbacteria bacterium RIFOXYB1_FULL_47_11]|uniref:Uncharacterized protein n=1 Tax=Candidatus Gottesmanbacteria bacterium RIFOXYB1_FULL_47_11 TaxID=1798401 RepID=A0A1F6BBT0_9BACT|nr:MAG: hypothetical protein A2363_00510 [Candidatus Gottesmanbacteria bacterium RIFOXYB1_FULL_47_11]